MSITIHPIVRNFLFILLGWALCCVIACGASQSKFDGSWWARASNDQKASFLDGYMDCSVFDGGHQELGSVSSRALTSTVVAYYKSHPSEMNALIGDVLLKVAPKTDRSPLNVNTTPTQKYGMSDGELWRQMEIAARVSYVEGYLDCLGKFVTIPSFSRSSSSYADDISKWYGVRADDPSEITESRVYKKIPEVLRLFSDQAIHSSKVTKASKN